MPNPRIIARFEGDTYDADHAWITKKSLRPPSETVKKVLDCYPDWVVHSQGHVSRNAARTCQKYIRARRGAWAAYEEYNLKVGVFPDDPEDPDTTWCVAICAEFPIDRGSLE